MAFRTELIEDRRNIVRIIRDLFGDVTELQTGSSGAEEGDREAVDDACQCFTQKRVGRERRARTNDFTTIWNGKVCGLNESDLASVSQTDGTGGKIILIEQHGKGDSKSLGLSEYVAADGRWIGENNPCFDGIGVETLQFGERGGERGDEIEVCAGGKHNDGGSMGVIKKIVRDSLGIQQTEIGSWFVDGVRRFA